MMRFLHVFFKYIGRIVVILVVLVVLVMILLYVPVVQNFVKRKVVQHVEVNLGMKMSVERIWLRFPLDLVVEKIYMGYTNGDTLLVADRVRVNVALGKLLRKEIEVRQLSVENAVVCFRDSLSGMGMRITARELGLRVNRLDVARQVVDIASLALKRGKMSLTLGESKADTTGEGVPACWRGTLDEMMLESVDFEMAGLPLGEVHAGMGEVRVERAEVSLEGQTIRVGRLALIRGYCELLLADAGKTGSVVAMDPGEGMPWSVGVGHVEMTDNRFLMRSARVPGGVERFPGVIRVSSLSVEMDSVFNRGTEFSAVIQRFGLQGGNGFDLRDLSCRVVVERDRVDVSNLKLSTPYSQLAMDVKAGSGIDNFGRNTPVQLSVSGEVAGRDVLLFLPDSNARVRGWLRDRVFELDGLIRGKVDGLEVARLAVRAGDDFTLEGEGEVAFITDRERMAGRLVVTTRVGRGAFFAPLLAGGGTGRWVVPSDLACTASVTLADQVARVALVVSPPRGELRVDGEYGFRDESYRARVEASALALDAFMPLDSLGAITATLVVGGKGFDRERAMARGNVDLKSFVYRGYDYGDILLTAALEEGRLDGVLRGGDRALDVDLAFRCTGEKGTCGVHVDGEVRNVDLKALRFTPDALAFSLGVGVDAVLHADSTFSLHADFTRVMLRDRVVRSLGDVNVTFVGLRDRTRVTLDAGDLGVRFDAASSGYRLVDEFAATAGVLGKQWKAREFNMERLREVLPDFELDVFAARENVLNRYFEREGIRFGRLAMNAGTRRSADFGWNAAVYGVQFGGVMVDSVFVKAYQEGISLDYGAHVFGVKNQLEELALLVVEGNVEHDQVNARAREQGQEAGVFFDVGVNVAFQDSSFVLSISPDPLVLGYVSWQVNRGNYIRIGKGEIPSANLQLLNGDRRIRLVSEEGANHSPASLHVDVKGIDLGQISKALTFVPEMSGLLGVDVQVHREGESVEVAGKVTADGFYYRQDRVGDLGVGFTYRLSRETAHDVDFTLSVDGEEALSTRGSMMTGVEDRGVALDVQVPGLPLRLAHAFVPPGMVRLNGNLKGSFQVRGQVDRPLINGGFHFVEGTVGALPVGTTFAIDSSRVVIQDNLLRFDRFGLIAPNRRRMELVGSVNFASFTGVEVDASVTAKNFQAMKVAENAETLVYGKVYVDVSGTVKGMLDDLRVRGSVGLLDNSVINYTLKSSPLSVTDRSLDVVRFVSFRDTARVVEVDSLRQIRSMALDLLMSVNIAPLVSLNLLLSGNGQNRVSINGGGNLTYSLNPVGESRLVGRYVLTSGVVAYGLPVIGQKDFAIQDGGYVEWTGEVANPVLNIVAAESVSASVSDDNQSSRLVTFTSMIRIVNTLEKPEVTFDLSAAGDVTIQNQLAAMTQEERSREAINLMIYGSYSGPGTVAKSSATDNAMNSFVEKELNQWSRKYLKNMDLTFGINTYNQLQDGGAVKKTDYSYQFSKRLFNNRVRVKVGGRISTDNDPTAGSVEENLVDDISVEYVFGKNPNFFLKIFRHTGYESVLEGEITQTGVGVVLRKKFQKFLDIFRKKKKEEVAYDKSNDTPEGAGK